MTETLTFPERYTTVAAADAVRTVFAAVNDRGGICGRRLQLDLVNPVWGTAPWEPGSNAVAGIAGPLDEHADAAIADGRVDGVQTPMVSTGLRDDHFGSPWVWPVLPPAQAITRVAVDHAHRALGARTFALVYETGPVYRTAAKAFEEYIASLPGASVRHVEAIDPSDGDYKDDALKVVRACLATGCDFVLFAASEAAMAAWPTSAVLRGTKATAGLPGLVTSPYVRECVPLALTLGCESVHLWSGPNAAAQHGGGLPPECTSGHGGVTLVDGARVGACRLVEALRRAGPDVTRERLRHALDALAAELALTRAESDGRRAFDIPARALRPTAVDSPLPMNELRPFTDWLRDPLVGRAS